MARNLRNYPWGISEYAVDSGLIEDNPMPPVRVLRKLDAITTINEQTPIAMLLVVLTACRKAEVIGARWSEFDLDATEWEVPAERMKAGRAHWVALSRQAIRLLKNLRSIVPIASAFRFPNRVDPKRPMADRSLNALMERLGFSGDGTPHRMRVAFSTHFNGEGANVDVIEHCLAHVPNNRLRAAYNRHAYQAERRALLQAWANHLDKLRRTVPTTKRIQQRLQKRPAVSRAGAGKAARTAASLPL